MNDKNEDRATKGDDGNNELNINDCSSTLPSYSSFKSAIFQQPKPKRPQGI